MSELNSEEPRYQVTAVLNHIRYPKGKTLGIPKAEWGVVVWSVIDASKSPDEMITGRDIIVTGVYGMLSETARYQLTVTLHNDPKYGKQYKLVNIFEIPDITNQGGKHAYLQTICTERQLNLIERSLTNPWEVIISGSEKVLANVKGIGKRSATAILRRHKQSGDYMNAIMELSKYGLSVAYIKKIVDACGSTAAAIDVVAQHPYQLINMVKGIGFRKADTIAMQGGLPETSEERIAAYIQFYLDERAQAGQSYVYADMLLEAMDQALDLGATVIERYTPSGERDGTNLSHALDDLKKRRIVSIDDDVSKNSHLRHVYLRWVWSLEQSVALNLKRLQQCRFRKPIRADWLARVHEVEVEQGFAFTEEQLAGIELALKEPVILITGGAGSGKTSLLNGVLAALGCYDGDTSFAQCSLSGKAAARMTEVTGCDGQTIHRLIQYGNNGPAYNIECPLEYDVIVVDEISLVGGKIFSLLLDAIPNGAKLIMLGDMGQLEAIGCMNIAADIYHAPSIPTVELTKIHRQAAKSGIITTAASVRNGKQFFKSTDYGSHIYGSLADMELVLSEGRDTLFEDIILAYQKWYHSNLVKQNVMDIQVLCPVKTRGAVCVEKVNTAIQELLNPAEPDKAELQTKYSLYRNGDKVMCTSNTYHVSAYPGRADEIMAGCGYTDIFNGWVGIITSISDAYEDDSSESGKQTRKIGIYFPISDSTVFIEQSDFLSTFQLGYASTVHKYQGSSVKCVLGVIDYSTPPKMLTKELVYTLITRAEKYCMLIAQSKALQRAIHTSAISEKMTFLPQMLEQSSQNASCTTQISC
jgi:exodeoxyribonuclease V alpha subunit